MKLQDPIIIKNVFDEESYSNLLNIINNKYNIRKYHYDTGFGRYSIGESQIKELTTFANALVPLARKIFKSNTLVPSYTLFTHYEGDKANLFKHIDDNALYIYHDFCLYQKKEWGLFVENKEYTLFPNEALAYYGNAQWHWRNDFPEKESNYVAMIFFHFVEPDHWYFTKGPGYLDVIQKKMTEEEYANRLID